MNRIVTLSLVRDEERFVERVLRNVVEFSDRIIVCDNGSSDGTPGIVARVAAGLGKIELHSVRHPSESHEIVRPLMGTGTWLLAADGDEIYDPECLRRLRLRLLDGEFDHLYRIYGNALNCSHLDGERKVARGYLAPPCRSMTKLYNFRSLRDWTGCSQRLHGGVIQFADGYGESNILKFHETHSWEDSPFRCLHTVFLRRSSVQPEELVARPNVTETYRTGVRAVLGRLARRLSGRGHESDWKHDKYRRGPEVTKDVSAFLGP
jgi:glycosyltransferase involved in cell wall biosynthesis